MKTLTTYIIEGIVRLTNNNEQTQITTVINNIKADDTDEEIAKQLAPQDEMQAVRYAATILKNYANASELSHDDENGYKTENFNGDGHNVNKIKFSPAKISFALCNIIKADKDDFMKNVNQQLNYELTH